MKVLLPDVSIIIPTYNRADRIGKAVETCLAATGCTIEVIVVDDGSIDNTKKTLRETFGDIFYDESGTSHQSVLSRDTQTVKGIRSFPRIRYYYQKNQGACAARNLGIEVSVGQYVKFLDSDDELLAGALSEELAFAKKTNADVVVTGWQERTYDENLDAVTSTRHVSAPNLDRGIDDMLLGRAPWTAAALYKKSRIASIRWDRECQKAQEWLWAWTVCLGGLRFATLEIESSIYNQFSGQRITSMGDPFLRSTETRQRILLTVENKLRELGQLPIDRRHALVQYYYKDSKVLCEADPSRWRKLWAHCDDLAPGFTPIEQSSIVRPFVMFLGVYWGILLYVKLRKVVRLLGFRQSRVH